MMAAIKSSSLLLKSESRSAAIENRSITYYHLKGDSLATAIIVSIFSTAIQKLISLLYL